MRVGLVVREQDLVAWRGRLGELTRRVAAAGIDHITVGDHISFSDGHGVDGLIQATALLAAHRSLQVQTGIYLLALRHPAVVARQLATIAMVAPGRLTFGVGVGGDDERELELCGVRGQTRGARMEEALRLVKQFMTGEEITFQGRFFEVNQAAIRPALHPPVPILIGGRSDAALSRTARLGDGWIAVWISPRRFAEARDKVQQEAALAGRGPTCWMHTVQMWAGLGATVEQGVARVRSEMEASYSLPFERFSRYTPCGRPDDVAAFL